MQNSFKFFNPSIPFLISSAPAAPIFGFSVRSSFKLEISVSSLKDSPINLPDSEVSSLKQNLSNSSFNYFKLEIPWQINLQP